MDNPDVHRRRGGEGRRVCRKHGFDLAQPLIPQVQSQEDGHEFAVSVTETRECPCAPTQRRQPSGRGVTVRSALRDAGTAEKCAAFTVTGMERERRLEWGHTALAHRWAGPPSRDPVAGRGQTSEYPMRCKCAAHSCQSWHRPGVRYKVPK